MAFFALWHTAFCFGSCLKLLHCTVSPCQFHSCYRVAVRVRLCTAHFKYESRNERAPCIYQTPTIFYHTCNAFACCSSYLITGHTECCMQLVQIFCVTNMPICSHPKTAAMIMPGKTATTSPPTVCRKCAINQNSGKLSCCARGGSWHGKCGDTSKPEFDYTWTMGNNACKRKSRGAGQGADAYSYYSQFMTPGKRHVYSSLQLDANT